VYRALYANPSGRAVKGVGLRPLPCWDCGFESHRGHGCLSVVSVLCVVRLRSVRRADHSSRGVLLTVVRRCVWSRNLVNEEVLTHRGAVAQKKINSALYDSFPVTDWATFEKAFTKTLRVEIISTLQICVSKMISTWRPYVLFYKPVNTKPL